MDKEAIKEYVGQPIRIGIPHMSDPNKLFFYYGKIVKIYDTSVKIITKDDTIKILSLDWIKLLEITDRE